jgi:hypothetical protein
LGGGEIERHPKTCMDTKALSRCEGEGNQALEKTFFISIYMGTYDVPKSYILLIFPFLFCDVQQAALAGRSLGLDGIDHVVTFCSFPYITSLCGPLSFTNQRGNSI